METRHRPRRTDPAGRYHPPSLSFGRDDGEWLAESTRQGATCCHVIGREGFHDGDRPTRNFLFVRRLWCPSIF